jgi:hypothetical protein
MRERSRLGGARLLLLLASLSPAAAFLQAPGRASQTAETLLRQSKVSSAPYVPDRCSKMLDVGASEGRNPYKVCIHVLLLYYRVAETRTRVSLPPWKYKKGASQHH